MAPSPDLDVTFAGDDLVLRLAALAYLARFSAVSRIHAKSALRLYFSWCTDQQPAPLAVARTEVERYMRWMQEVPRFKPATLAHCVHRIVLGAKDRLGAEHRGESGLAPGGLQALRIRLLIGESQRAGKGFAAFDGLCRIRVRQRIDALARGQHAVVIAFGADRSERS
ncbi:hypothetical protein [Nocardia acidivorans]|uniref:hypothetical protein n=1 Tax=Nocardia acidivorans TaxID=404580 RepID=UPI000AAAA9E4|nr:hypothetical protein [Nocardia acidivorans]